MEYEWNIGISSGQSNIAINKKPGLVMGKSSTNGKLSTHSWPLKRGERVQKRTHWMLDRRYP